VSAAYSLAADVVRDAEAATSDSAVVRIEAQSKVGELLKQMAERARHTNGWQPRS
jgi:hypothetical protein